MGEPKVYMAHRYSLLLNVPVVVAGALLVGGLLSGVVFGLFAVLSLVLFFFAYLGEEKSYYGTVVFGLVEAAYSVFAFADGSGFRSAPTLIYGAVLVVLGVMAALRFRRKRAEGKKALSDFVPPAFG